MASVQAGGQLEKAKRKSLSDWYNGCAVPDGDDAETGSVSSSASTPQAPMLMATLLTPTAAPHAHRCQDTPSPPSEFAVVGRPFEGDCTHSASLAAQLKKRKSLSDWYTEPENVKHGAAAGTSLELSTTAAQPKTHEDPPVECDTVEGELGVLSRLPSPSRNHPAHSTIETTVVQTGIIQEGIGRLHRVAGELSNWDATEDAIVERTSHEEPEDTQDRDCFACLARNTARWIHDSFGSLLGAAGERHRCCGGRRGGDM